MTDQTAAAPSRVAWAVRPSIQGDEQRAWQTVFEVLKPDFVVEDTSVTLSGGAPVASTCPHRLADYFASVTIQLSRRENLPAYALVFEPHPTAKPFWKDVMLKVVKQLRDERL